MVCFFLFFVFDAFWKLFSETSLLSSSGGMSGNVSGVSSMTSSVGLGAGCSACFRAIA